MHLLATSGASFDDLIEPVDLAQPAGEILILSFADTDLSGIAGAWRDERSYLPSVRLANLRDLRHPMSVDVWLERTTRHAKVILVRLLGGLDRWRYGVDRLVALARERQIVLALLPGEDRDEVDSDWPSTLPLSELKELLRFFREGGKQNLRFLLRRLANHAGADLEAPVAVPIAANTAYRPGDGAVAADKLISELPKGRSVVPILFYRSSLMAADTATIDALCDALAQRNLVPLPLAIKSLKDADTVAFVREIVAKVRPVALVTTTAFAAQAEHRATDPFEGDAIVLQAAIAATAKKAWQESGRGLGAADLAMQIVLPELDGRVLLGVVSFKDAMPPDRELAYSALVNRPEPSRIAQVADRIAALVRLRKKSRSDRRVAVLMPAYPGAPGREAYAVGLDVPASVLAAMTDLKAAGYDVDFVPKSGRDLIDQVVRGSAQCALPLDAYVEMLSDLPSGAVAQVDDAWGNACDDPDVRDGAFRFRARLYGDVLVALPPDRGAPDRRRADYHDLARPPRHALVAFSLWMQRIFKADVVLHMGAHGTFEWLPGKAVALSRSCFPEVLMGPVPVIYPFIVSNPGEAAQAKRRLGAVTIGHLPPPLVSTTLSGDARELEQLVEEYAQADGLDARRRDLLCERIVECAHRTGLAGAAGVDADADREDALRRIDAWLCDLKDLPVKDGLHVYGRASVDVEDFLWDASARNEQDSLLDALDGLRVLPGPSGAPARGRRDVLPTGRNLFAADPRMLPTPTAMEFGRRAAEEVIRSYMQNHGEMLESVVLDLWGSATLRTGGEEIAQGLALLGCRPTWDHGTGRVTGIEVLPPAALGRPRVDVTLRVSGLFRDMFPAQISLLDAAVRLIAARDEADDENPLRAAFLRSGRSAESLKRIFGNAPGSYGAGTESLLGAADAAEIAARYLSTASHSYGGPDGHATAAPGAFRERVRDASALLHPSDDPGRDLLEGGEDAAFVGGFASAARELGGAPDLIMLDLTDAGRPRARPLSTALARIVRARAVNPKFIAAQMRHGFRGAAELAESVVRLFEFANTTGMVSSALFDLVHDAYVRDPSVREFLLRENPAAAQAISDALEAARERGLWHPLRNDLGLDS
jgi:cobaltochelatase CobN